MGLGTIEIHADLIERARFGDQQAMFRLYKLHIGAMYNTCIRIVANKNDAEDIIQESFISAFQGLKGFKGESTFGAWLKRIVINKSINHMRKKRESFTNIENIQILDEEDQTVMTEIPMELVHDEIKKLPDKARVILNLYLLEDYQHKEIAEMLGISESTSKSQYQRARKLLQESILNRIGSIAAAGNG